MDIRRLDAEPTADERAAVDALLGPPLSAWDGGARGNARDAHVATVGGRDSRAMRHLLLPSLRALQGRVGWITAGGLGYICDRLNVPPADAWGVATFYALLATSPRPPRVVHVCDDIACKCRGADDLTASLERSAGPPHSHDSAPSSHLDARASNLALPTSDLQPPASAWMRSPCLGKCDQSPAAFVTMAGDHPHEELLGHVTADRVLELLAGAAPAGLAVSRSGRPVSETMILQPAADLRLLRRVGRV